MPMSLWSQGCSPRLVGLVLDGPVVMLKESAATAVSRSTLPSAQKATQRERLPSEHTPMTLSVMQAYARHLWADFMTRPARSPAALFSSLPDANPSCFEIGLAQGKLSLRLRSFKQALELICCAEMSGCAKDPSRRTGGIERRSLAGQAGVGAGCGTIGDDKQT